MVVILSCVLSGTAENEDYVEQVRQWRGRRKARLMADDGYLTLGGLYWLKPGENTFGTDPSNDFVLPAGSAPARAGTLLFRDGRTRVRAASGLTFEKEGKTVREAELTRDPTAISLGSLKLWVHYSGERAAIRLRDQNSPIRKEFKGLSWYPIQEEYRIEGRLLPYPEPKEVKIVNVLGDVDPASSPGLVEFSLHGRNLSLQPTSSDGHRLFFVFRDRTSGKETYAAARFLYADLEENNRVILDFNKAYNPPCAFNPFTTCPLPVPQNRLRVSIEAGELDYH